MSRSKQYISLFFLTILLVVKLVGLHEFTHSESEKYTDCDICEFVITTNKTPLLTNSSIAFETLVKHTYIRTLNCEYSYTYVKNYFCSSAFGRPPPTV